MNYFIPGYGLITTVLARQFYIAGYGLVIDHTTGVSAIGPSEIATGFGAGTAMMKGTIQSEV
jgi:hypothetical protein